MKPQEAWVSVTGVLTEYLSGKFPLHPDANPISDPVFREAVACARECGLAALINKWALSTPVTHFLGCISSDVLPRACGDSLVPAIDAVRQSLSEVDRALCFVWPSHDSADFALFCRSRLFTSDAPSAIAVGAEVARFLSERFASFSESRSNGGDSRARSAFVVLESVGLVSLHEPALFGLLSAAMDEYLASHCAGVCERSLSGAIAWLESACVAWLRNEVFSGRPSIEAECFAWKHRLSLALHEKYAVVRASVAFDMIKEYPDSIGALDDLRESLQKTSRFADLKSALLKSMSQRLLTVGASTSDILVTFVKAVKAMKIIDPSGVMLESIASPVRAYLKSRKDTVQRVVESFVTESSEDIADAFKTRPVVADSNPDEWCPEPTTPEPIVLRASSGDGDDSGPASVKGSKATDIVALLEELWGGADSFVDQYREALAQSILALPGWNADREVGQLELLKMRFGEASMQPCAVMVRDVDESRRLSLKLPSVAESFEFSALVVSHMYWPESVKEEYSTMSEESLPPQVKESFEQFSKEYTRMNPSKRLQWLVGQGLVTIELELPGSSVPEELDVTPLQAMVITCFSEQPSWSLDEIATQLNVLPEEAKKAIGFWLTKRAITVYRDPQGSSDSYCVAVAASQQKQDSQHEDAADVAQSPASPEAVGGDDNIDIDGEVAMMILGLLATGEGMNMRDILSGVTDLMSEVSQTVVRQHLEALVKAGKVGREGDLFVPKPDDEANDEAF